MQVVNGLHQPDRHQTQRKIDEVRAFRALYAQAREAQAEGYADELTALADEAKGLDAAGVNAARLRVDTRKWIASKLLPRKYGDRLDVNHQGGISVAAVSQRLRTIEPVTFDDEDDATGTLLAEDSTPAPPGVAPSEGTPISVTTGVTPAQQISKIPSEIPQTFVEQPTTLDALL